jgi:tRNA pseudouridine55 synthase
MNGETLSVHDFRGEGEILFIDKPLDWTSFDVVKKMRSLFDVRKVGHAGTLDPKATGLLIVCTGKKTKGIDQFVGMEKEYTGVCELGVRTPSFDSETSVSELKDSSGVTAQQIQEAAESLLGKQMQTPPMYSAVKYGGIPLYRYARAGKTVERVEREIDVVQFNVLAVHHPFIEFSIICTKGTYIRSLIEEFGLRLGCGATVTALRRTRIGAYSVTDALTMDKLIKWRETIVLKDQVLDEMPPSH